MQPIEPIEPHPETADVDAVIAEICRRLEWRIRPVVSHLSDREIEQLLARMTWLKYKFEGSSALDTLPRNPTRTESPVASPDASSGETRS